LEAGIHASSSEVFFTGQTYRSIRDSNRGGTWRYATSARTVSSCTTIFEVQRHGGLAPSCGPRRGGTAACRLLRARARLRCEERRAVRPEMGEPGSPRGFDAYRPATAHTGSGADLPADENGEPPRTVALSPRLWCRDGPTAGSSAKCDDGEPDLVSRSRAGVPQRTPHRGTSVTQELSIQKRYSLVPA